jgi:hypothetical protein
VRYLCLGSHRGKMRKLHGEQMVEFERSNETPSDHRTNIAQDSRMEGRKTPINYRDQVAEIWPFHWGCRKEDFRLEQNHIKASECLGLFCKRIYLLNEQWGRFPGGKYIRNDNDISKKATIHTKNVLLWGNGCMHRKTDWIFGILVEFQFRSAKN